ncbi:hypothetical protein CKO11_01705 [Rhodobacter sp. TJ_12]|nr:hypothetical protein [Rhodobacter sp. TJ_12]
MQLQDLSPDHTPMVTEALTHLGANLVTAGAELMLFEATQAETAQNRIAAFAATVSPAAKVGADLHARALAVWLMPEGHAALLTGALHNAARTHAPHLRVNAVHFGGRWPAPEPWQAAWGPAQPHPSAPPRAKALAQALSYLFETRSVTGQLLHLSPL